MPAFYISLQTPIPGVDAVGLEGRALSRQSDRLEALAKRVGVQPLLSFFSIDQEEASALLGLNDSAQRPIPVSEQQWFSAEDGLKTIAALLTGLAEASEENVALIAELKQFQQVLETARAKNVAWHLAIDI